MVVLYVEGSGVVGVFCIETRIGESFPLATECLVGRKDELACAVCDVAELLDRSCVVCFDRGHDTGDDTFWHFLS